MSCAVRLAISLVAAALVLAPAAAAKQPGGQEAGLTVCGATGCTTSDGTDPKSLGALLAGDRTGPPKGGAPFYQVTLPMRVPAPGGEGPLWEVLYVPSLGIVRSPDGHGHGIWLALPAAARSVY